MLKGAAGRIGGSDARPTTRVRVPPQHRQNQWIDRRRPACLAAPQQREKASISAT